jgi:hypothetical protein
VRVLIDTNVIREDFLSQRELFFQDADQLLQARSVTGQIVGSVTATALTVTVLYIAQKTQAQY